MMRWLMGAAVALSVAGCASPTQQANKLAMRDLAAAADLALESCLLSPGSSACRQSSAVHDRAFEKALGR
jgi:uncharacterized lipoprotein YmbA